MQIAAQQPSTEVVRDDPDEQTKKAPVNDGRAGLISVDPERHSGTPCFAGTRVPVQDLFDYLEGGENLDSFLSSFPTVRREQAIMVIHLAEDKLLQELPIA